MNAFRRNAVVPVLLLAVAGAAIFPAPTKHLLAADKAAEAEKRDIEKWQGTWHAVSMENNGKQTPEVELKKITLTVNGTKYHFQNGDFNERGTYQFDVTKDPKQLDVVVGDGRDKGKVHQTIYKIDGDQITLCLEANTTNRPGKFNAAAGTGNILEVWRRVKR